MNRLTISETDPAPKVVIQRNPDDPMCPRISMGGNPKMGYYLTFRGDPQEILKMLETCSTAYKEHLTSGKPFDAGFDYQ